MKKTMTKKEINDMEIQEITRQFTQAWEIIRLTGNERSDLQSHFDDLLSIVNKLNK